MPGSMSLDTAGSWGPPSSDELEATGHTNILTATRQELDLRDQAAVNAWFRNQPPRLCPG